ncbi:heat shock protein beta-1-like [Nerophis ophidion]|uniref:heat shock protein beta-1-like n=1 Tax=Nerophis ophidion TaxID=159077 RepID=UPI002ADF430F|nr:heat shock protein beta-1-like [Nerophis ophidion]
MSAETEQPFPTGWFLSASWPGCTVPSFVPERGDGKEDRMWWRVGLDVAAFFSTEVSVGAQDGFLRVEGRHDERADQHGFISRCFTRRYRLPAGMDVTKMVSSLSVDGILTVEGPIPDSSAAAPTGLIIPIKVEADVPEEETLETNPGPLQEEGEEEGEPTLGTENVLDDVQSQQSADASKQLDADEGEVVKDEDIQGDLGEATSAAAADDDDTPQPVEQQLGTEPSDEALGQELQHGE